jgi:glycerol-1-phosphate dehydrogenase [NAD(P)+]
MTAFDQLLGRSFRCECGSTHVVPVQAIAVERGVIDSCHSILAHLVDAGATLLIADPHTWEAAGSRVARALQPHRTVETCIVPVPSGDDLHASVELVAELALSFPDRYDLYLAVGSGTINDLTKALAHQRQRPYAVVATAASMNGYTSWIAALLDRGIKATIAATPPVAVLADPDILRTAPHELTLAGLGDLVSKPFCGVDWLLSALVRDEPYCPLPGRLLSDAFIAGLDQFPALATRDEQAVVELMRLLLLSGLGMTIAGTSSPASGGEHLVSHYWDMVNLASGRRLRLHGAQVGVASVAMNALFGQLLTIHLGATPFEPSPSPAAARANLEKSFGPLTDAVWPHWQAKLGARCERDLERLAEHETRIKTEIRLLLEQGRQVRTALAGCNAPMWAGDLSIETGELSTALRHARMIRNRYTALDVAAEVGILDRFADHYPVCPSEYF